jgi:23S rRNA (uracil1939-C5)-methyltransferase
MHNKQQTLTISKLGGLGDGIGLDEVGRTVYVPFTLPGDVVEITVTHEGRERIAARLEHVLTASSERAQPVCKHFTECGGCALQHLSPQNYRQFKENRLTLALTRAGYVDVHPELIVVPPATRRRAEFKLSITKPGMVVGFYALGSHRIVDLVECHVVVPALMAQLHALRPFLPMLEDATLLKELAIAEINGAIELVLRSTVKCSLTNRKLLQAYAKEQGIARIAWQRLVPKEVVGPIEIILEDIPIQLPIAGSTIANSAISVPVGAFLQATEAGEEAIRAASLQAIANYAATRTTPGKITIADFYAGLGLTSLLLHTQGYHVKAFEGDAKLAESLALTVERFGWHDITVKQRDLFKQPVPAKDLKETEIAILNPPFNGAEPQVMALVEASTPLIIMVSCNPITLERDLGHLMRAGYKIERALGIDQFVWSTHLESVVVCRLEQSVASPAL